MKARSFKVWVAANIGDQLAGKGFREPRAHLYATRFFRNLHRATLTLPSGKPRKKNSGAAARSKGTPS